MKLHELAMATLSMAVAIYLELADGVGRRPGRVPDLSLPRVGTSDRVLALFLRLAVHQLHPGDSNPAAGARRPAF